MNLLPAELGEGVALRVIEEDDAAPLAAALVRNRDHLAPWDPERPHAFWTEGGQSERIADLREDFELGRGLPLVLVDGPDIVGAITVSQIAHGPFLSGSVGYWLDGSYEGLGLVTRALGRAVEVCRDELALHRLQAAALVHNERSRRVLERAGFSEIGVAEGYLLIAGEWQDHVLYQRLLR
ncbi:GNAT family N-acetyltransferase [Demequina salsinemoris]|uniref:GNAT family N-acetyltransferase n=1 Tax=Demequina salsinemoris TaxID=577470 RepID=UPI0007845F51|nr:GNAT family N-acetyltransferase [Demequina salsinemoris]